MTRNSPFRISAKDIYPDKWCNHPLITAGERRRRRMERAKFIATHTKLEWQAMRAIFLNCPCCNTFNYLAAKDHVVSLVDGGSDGIENIQPLCWACNSSKGGISHDFRDAADPKWRDKLPVIVGILEEIESADRSARWIAEAEAMRQLNG